MDANFRIPIRRLLSNWRLFGSLRGFILFKWRMDPARIIEVRILSFSKFASLGVHSRVQPQNNAGQRKMDGYGHTRF